MSIASYIDHTLLKPEATMADISALCEEARVLGCAAVCVPPYYAPQAAMALDGSEVKLATVIGFPFGYSVIAAKESEIVYALAAGCEELDMVINIAALKSGDWNYLETEIRACIRPVKNAGKSIKTIIESGILTDNEIIRCCDLYAKHGVDFMKTSTGYTATGATVHAVKLMRMHLPPQVAIKASGGIRTYAFAQELLAAGANRLGCSASRAIIAEEQAQRH